MSVKATDWAWHQIFLGKIKNAGARLALLSLARLADDNGVWFISTVGLATNCGLTERGIDKSLKELKSACLLTTERRKKDNKDLPTRFFLQLQIDPVGVGEQGSDVGQQGSATGGNAVPINMTTGVGEVTNGDERSSPDAAAASIYTLKAAAKQPLEKQQVVGCDFDLSGIAEVVALGVIWRDPKTGHPLVEDTAKIKALSLKFTFAEIKQACVEVSGRDKDNRLWINNIQKVLVAKKQAERQAAITEAEKQSAIAKLTKHVASVVVSCTDEATRERFEMLPNEEKYELVNVKFMAWIKETNTYARDRLCENRVEPPYEGSAGSFLLNPYGTILLSREFNAWISTHGGHLLVN